MSRVFAISDIHVDHPENRQWVENLSGTSYQNDVLLLAGDVSDKLSLIKSTLTSLCEKFKEIFFVPGNHELWIRDKEKQPQTSIDKFHQILTLCTEIGVHTYPKKIALQNPGEFVWIVPLFSWYSTPDDDPENSLYVASQTEDEHLTKSAWMDNHMCVWSEAPHFSASKYFEHLNEDRVKEYDAPVVSLSHFLPRKDLIGADHNDIKRTAAERNRLGLPEEMPKRQGAMAGFNFTRYAGSLSIEKNIRMMKCKVHVHGHQHRNRDRVVDGVRYVSHCLGYKRERQQGLMYGVEEWHGPKQVWPTGEKGQD